MSYQLISTQIDKDKYPPPGQMIDIGGYRLHVQSMGFGSPTVVLDNGLGNIGVDWILVQPEIAKFTRVVSYDRAGTGWSETGPEPRISAQIVQELHTLLHKAKIPGPYVLVGHSFGGVNAQLFAVTFPEEVLGIVLVDSGHEEQEKRLPPNPFSESFLFKPTVARLATIFGMNRMMVNLFGKNASSPLPQPAWDTHLALCLTTKHWFSMLEESDALNESLEQFGKADHSILARIPCIVITAGALPDLAALGLDDHLNAYFQETFRVWGDLQTELVGRFKNGLQLIADKSDHMIPFHQPELIVQAVKELIE